RIVVGSAVYGLDVRVPGMLYAVIARPPTLGALLDSFDAAKATVLPGVRSVVRIDNGVAVVAENTWAAIQGRDALEVAWSGGGDPELSSAAIREQLAADARAGAKADGGDRVLQAFYEVPYLAHATMEPMNCTADVRADRCEIWAPTQVPKEARERAEEITGLPPDAIQVHVTFIGGGFGRRLQVDYVAEAVQVSQAVGGPVQVAWTREDDIRGDYFHPFTYHRAQASLDQPTLPDVQTYGSPRSVPTGAWRSVGNVPDAFVRESFLDEMASALGRDPYELRLELEPEALRGVLRIAATESGWGTALPDGWGRGIACHSTWGASSVAHVAEVSVETDGRVRVRRVVCAVDCGVVINPDMVVAQMEGGIVFGLTAALKGEGIILEDARVRQGNFHDYPLLRYDEMPLVEVHLVQSERPPSGVGEMGTPPIIPAVTNAIFAATGKRIRRIPVLPGDLLGA
ncbi:MAG: molybdopterin-dependent oxidoreductase, partial [Chloroflexi bacterium]|nr:molybdopterin-dependent oxidoreductase [Chloroflexota bacterium]